MQELFRKLFFSKSFRPEFYWKIIKVSTRNWMQPLFRFPSSGWQWDAIQRILAQERDKATPALWKNWFSITFAKNSLPKISAPHKYRITSAIKENANRYCSYFIAKWASKLRNAEGKGECQIWFKKLKNFSIFPTITGQEKLFWQKLVQHAAQPKFVHFISAKSSAIRSLL